MKHAAYAAGDFFSRPQFQRRDDWHPAYAYNMFEEVKAS
jgi:hypothetical protein